MNRLASGGAVTLALAGALSIPLALSRKAGAQQPLSHPLVTPAEYER